MVHTGLELGATIYLDYSIITKPGYYPALDINERLQETSPVKECKVSISVPENSPLAWQLLGSDAKASQATRNGAKEVSWTYVPAGLFPGSFPSSKPRRDSPPNRFKL